MSGMSAQQAFDTLGEMLEHRYSEWDNNLAKVPSWGEKIDTEVNDYIEGIRNVVRANLNWRYEFSCIQTSACAYNF